MLQKETFRELNAKVFGRFVADYVVGAGWDELGWTRFVVRVVAIGAGISIVCVVCGRVVADIVLQALVMLVVALGLLNAVLGYLGIGEEKEGRD